MRTRSIRHAPLALAAAALATVFTIVPCAAAQTTISYGGGTYTQNFDTLPGSGTITFDGAGPFDLSAAPVGASAMSGWYLAKTGGSGANAVLIANAGNTTTGGAYSYGVSGETDRALGAVASGTNVSAFGAVFVNTGSITLNSFSINFTMEQWRNGGSGNVNTLSFGYALGTGDILGGSFTPASGLDAVSVINAAGGGSLNGNLPANRATVSGTVSGLNWLPGQSLAIRWNDNDEGGADSGVAIDDFSFWAGGGARTLTWNGGPGGGTWTTNPAVTTWLDGPTPAAFANGDIANFTNTGVGTVTVDAAGVAPGATTVTVNAATYTFEGGSIGGNGALTKNGDGTLVLSNSNTFTGGTTVNGGVVIISSDAGLGVAGAGVTLSGGGLGFNGNVSSSRTITLTPDTTSFLSGGAFSSTVGSITGGGSLRVQGQANVTVTGPYTVGGNTTVAGGTLRLAQSSGSVNLSTSHANEWAGDLAIATGIRVNFNSGNFAGGGRVLVEQSGAILSTTGALIGQAPTIGNDILLNSNNAAGPFVTTIGATAQNIVTIAGQISGDSDVVFSSSTAGAGTGVVVLSNTNTYSGATTISTATAGVVRIGVNNALPATTDLVFGTGTFNAGALDLAGLNQTVNSLRSDTSGTINGIANTGAALSTLAIAGSATTSYAGRIGVPDNLSQLPGAIPNIALVLAPSHSGQLTLAAANNYIGGTVVHGGTLLVAHAEALGGGSLTVSGGTARLAPGLDAPLVLPAATVGGSGRFDIADNAVVIDYDSTSPIAAIRTALAGGFAGGAWSGPGITSSGADASQRGIAYVEASSIAAIPPEFGNVDGTAVLLRVARYGDANLDGVVNLQDFNALAANFGLSGVFWRQGDFNYDGAVTLQDFNRLASNFGLSAAGPDVTPEGWAALAAAVPEPAAALLAVLPALMSLRPRRRGTPLVRQGQ